MYQFKQLINEYAQPDDYQKGVKFFNLNLVIINKVHYDMLEQKVIVNGSVIDSEIFQPTLTFYKAGQLKIECQDVNDYHFCAHLVALLLKFEEYLQTKKTYNSNVYQCLKDYLISNNHWDEVIVLDNKDELKSELMNKLTSINSFYQKDYLFNELIIVIKKDQLSLLLIHQDQEYKINDLNEFYHCYQDNTLYQIKDKLINISISTFNDLSNKLITYLYHYFMINPNYQNRSFIITNPSFIMEFSGLKVKVIEEKTPLTYVNESNNYLYFSVNNDTNTLLLNKEYRIISDTLYHYFLSNTNIYVIEANETIDQIIRLIKQPLNDLALVELVKAYLIELKLMNDDNTDVNSIEYVLEVLYEKPLIKIKLLLKDGLNYYNVFDNIDKMVEANYLIEFLSQAGFKIFQKQMISDDLSYIINLLENVIPYLNDSFIIRYDSSFKDFYTNTNGKINFNLSFVDGLIQMDLNNDTFTNEELNEIFTALENKKKQVLSSSGKIISLDNEELLTNIMALKDLEINFDDLINTNITLPRYYGLYMDSSLLTFDKNESFVDLIKDIKYQSKQEILIPQLNATLRDYQITGYQWLYSNYQLGFGSILADDMGLGKTIQVIAFLKTLYLKQEDLLPSIIIVPKSLIYNWAKEFEMYGNGMEICMVLGNKEQRSEIIKNNKAPIILSTYDQFKRDLDLYEKNYYECLIIDEAQVIKNSQTAVSKAIKIINRKYSIALSGTPIENNLMELWSIFDFILPYYLKSYKKFKDVYEKPIVEGDNDKLKRLLTLVKPFILRRHKKDVLKELPPKLESNVYTQMSFEQEKIYNSYFVQIKQQIDDYQNDTTKNHNIQILSLILRLRQICAHPQLVDPNYQGESGKLETCLDIIDNAIEGSHKILLFSQFTSMLKIIEKKLISKGVKYLYLDGQTPVNKRLELVDQFNSEPYEVFLISLKAGGSGLNLTSADTIIHYDPWWNPAVMDQASDRAHRIGQNNVVQVMNLVTSNSIEEKIIKLQASKKDLMEKILNNENSNLKNLSEKQLLELFEE